MATFENATDWNSAMPTVTNATTADTALLVMDLQNERVHPQGKTGAGGLAKIVEEAHLLEHVRKVLDTFRQRSWPIVHIGLAFRPDYADALSVAPRVTKLKSAGLAVRDTWGVEFAEQVAPLQSEMTFLKQSVNPFFNTGLLTWLLNRGVRRLVLCGIATHLVVESSARFADDAGFAVVVLRDCCQAPDAEAHRYALDKSLPLFGRVTTSEEFLDELSP